MTNFETPSHISIIGVGSLGGFLAKEISSIDFINEITIVDFDIVKNENLSNSIYDKDDIGKYKTDALYSKLFKRKKINIITDQYVESNINFSSSDMIIDCRDILYYDKNITFKVFISGTYLIVDCKKRSDSDLYEGHYGYGIDKCTIRYAATIVSNLIAKKLINKLIENQSLHRFDLQHLDKFVLDELSKTKEKSNNIIYEESPVVKKVKNLFDICENVVKTNKDKKIKFKTDKGIVIKDIPRNTIKSFEDFLPILSPTVSSPVAYPSYMLCIEEKRGEIIIEIIPNCGGA